MSDKLYYDPATQGEEPGIEEGDWMDYIQPLRSLFSGNVIKTAVTKGAKSAIRALRDRMPSPPSKTGGSLDYTAQKIGRGPTSTTTDATTGFKNKPGSYKVID